MSKRVDRHRLLPVLLISGIFLAVMLTFLWSVGRYWSGVLQPRLQLAAETHAEVLANAQATPLVNILERNKWASQRRELNGKIQQLLLITDPAIQAPLFRAVDLMFDYDLVAAPEGSLDIVSGEPDCPRCYVVEVPLMDSASALVGIATFWVTDAYYQHLAGDMKVRLYTELSVALVVLAVVWLVVLALYFRLQRAKELVEVSDRAKTRFLANVSHELRTPLNAILGYTQLFKRNRELMKEYGRGISTIDRSADHLLLMINDILDFSRADYDKVQLQAGEVSLVEFLGALMEMTLIRAHLKDIEFHHQFDEGLPQVVLCDDKRLRQILLNLLNNAVKFTHKGGVMFKVTVLSQSTGEQAATVRLCFEIIDTGPGIPGNQLEEIFLPFHQLENSEASAEGSGLGLAISSSLLSLMDSRLRVESKVEKGSRFWFELKLPVIIASPALVAPNQGDPVGYHGRERHVLSVDDNALNRDVIHQRLESYGFRVSDAESGARALEILDRDKVDLVLLDLLMPEQDGFVVLEELRQRYSDEELPVIAMTADAEPETEARARAVGFRAVLIKPTSDDELLRALAETLGLSWRYSAQEQGVETDEPTPTLVLPDAELMDSLRVCAQQHDVLGLRKLLSEIETQPELAVFAQRVQAMVWSYQFSQLISWLDSVAQE
jgi:signal transduction histidine kinase/DNA-binding NarL/FixJ family response regulator